MPQYSPKRGLVVPPVSVFDKDGSIIEEEQRNVIRHVYSNGSGADAIFGVGTTGECNRLDNKRRQQLMKITVDEVRKIDPERKLEAWIGVTGQTKAETLDNIQMAMKLKADAVVIAPLSVGEIKENIREFFDLDVQWLFGQHEQSIPVYLYDNADISVNGDHIRTKDVKYLSKLPFIKGIKVSAEPRVLANYLRASRHHKRVGEFAPYIGDVETFFDAFGKTNILQRFLLREAASPRSYIFGVVNGLANWLPEESKRAWQAADGNYDLLERYHELFSDAKRACEFEEGGRKVMKIIPCLKYALFLDGVIKSYRMSDGAVHLLPHQQEIFQRAYEQVKEYAAKNTL